MLRLNKDQEKALEKLNNKSRNVAILGSAGVGKSTLIKKYLENNPKTKVLTSTGIAAVLLGDKVKASTFHSFFGLGKMDDSLNQIIDNIDNNELIKKRISQVDEIIVDEISMLSGKAFDYANFIAKYINDPEKPFGGIRIILVGDFFQLGPVNTDPNIKINWIFDSISWDELNLDFFELSEIMRTNDVNFIKILHKVRTNIIDREVTNFLNSKITKDDDSFIGTRIFPRKKQVNEYNEKKLKELPGKEKVLSMLFEGESIYIEKLRRSLPVESPLIIKEGALVMARVNYNKNGIEYVNGTTGIIKQITNEYIVIETKDGKEIPIFKTLFSLNSPDGDPLATAFGFPLVLAYAITVHKSQGCSLDAAIVDLRSGGSWASGLGYTALSRLTNSNGLKILGWNKYSFYVDKKIIDFYKKIRSKSSFKS